MPNRVLSVPKRALQSTGISQDNIIFGMVLLAFVIFITIKGELRTYMAFFTPGANQGPSAVPVSTTAQTSTTTPAVAAANSIFGSPNIPNPGLFGSANPVGALTGNPSTLFGALPTLQAIPGALMNNLGINSIINGIGSFFGGQGITGGSTSIPSSTPTGGGIGMN
jgi:hypothetical protein